MWRTVQLMGFLQVRRTLILTLSMEVAEAADQQHLEQHRNQGKKRKRCKGELIEDVMAKVMKTVTEGLKRCILNLEDKRMRKRLRKRCIMCGQWEVPDMMQCMHNGLVVRGGAL